MFIAPISNGLLRVGILGVLLSVFIYNLVFTMHCTPQTICVQTYWIRVWEMSYAEGFTRRALLGSALDAVSAEPLTIIAVNITATAVLAIIAGLLTINLVRMFPDNWPVPVAALLLGPTTMVLAETLGDSMQVGLLLLCVSCLLPSRARMIALWIFLPLSAAVHEAAIFLLWPAALLLLFGRLRVWLAVLSAAAVMAVGLFAMTTIPAQATPPVLTFFAPDGTLLEIPAQPALPIARALELEYQYHFGSTTSTLKLFYQAVSFSAWPLAFLIVLCHLRGSVSLLRTYGLLLAMSLPLYVVAHDWSRFAVFTVLASLLLEALHPHASPCGARTRPGKWLEEFIRQTPRAFVYVFPILFLAHDNYRTWGLLPINLVQIYGLLAVSVAVSWRYHSRTQPATTTAR